MKQLVVEINNHFAKKSDYFRIFAKLDSRVESWFKAEMFVLLERLVEESEILLFKREFKIPLTDGKRFSIDFKIDKDNKLTKLIELKALCISQSAGTPRNLNFYFGDDHVGLIQDFRKMNKVILNATKYVIGFIYPKPTNEAWQTALRKIPADLRGWHCITNINDYPETHFVSVWATQ